MLVDRKTHLREQSRARLEPSRQAQLQQAAREKHERESAAHEAHLASLVVKESEPNLQNPLQAARVAKVSAKPQNISTELTGKVVSEKRKQPRVSRVAAIRAQQRHT